MRTGVLKLKPQLFCGDEPAIGPGKATLLEAIDREGSISAAARAMGMSYRKAWLLVDSMNRCWRDRLVETSSSGAHLTACGHQVRDSFRSLEAELARVAEGQALRALQRRLLPAPRESRETAAGANQR
jgi:molybdate transport system regulatory protein